VAAVTHMAAQASPGPLVASMSQVTGSGEILTRVRVGC